ncbi:tubulin-folding cofactor C [Iris pallida]|uniref:Tubulin-folding cofactor C n=1 Tax=Iris pallida TaxID=29817 RepID=A0AAX6F911_IRIPA|nr:tubulin-folding cofactor C [Iris pallida]
MGETDPHPHPDPDPTPANKKHQAMLDRLSNHQARRGSGCRLGSESAPAFESVSSFLSLFSSAKQSIESDLSRIRTLSSDPKPDIDRVSASVSDLERTLAENSYFLPSYELRSSLKSISDLKEELETLTSDLVPKKKFSFRKNPNPRKNPSEGAILAKDSGVSEQIEVGMDKRSNFATGSVVVKDSPGFRNKKGAILVKNFKVSEEGMGEFTLTDLDSCEVYLKGRIRALFFNRITNCRIYCGPVLGSILIEEVSGCLFMLASHQIRIHGAKESDFYLRVRSRPIIEDSGGVRFAPYGFFYEGIEEELTDSGLGEETGSWANVDDFKWLRAVQSPNWCVIPQEERAGVVDASVLEEKGGADQ